MRESRKAWSFRRSFVELRPATKLAPLTLLLSLLIPAPFGGENAQWRDLVNRTERRDAHKRLDIYSVVQSHRTDLKQSSAWAIANTVFEESRKYSLDPLLVLAIIKVESRFRPAAVSADGARGLMQIHPLVANAVAEETNLRLDSKQGILNPEALDDPIFNIKVGVFYLSYLKKRFTDLKLALTAYNRGPTQVKNRLEGDQEIPSEYAMKVLSAYRVYQDSRQTPKRP